VRYFRGTIDETELLRFVQWEALEPSDGTVVAEQDRVDMFKLKVKALRRDQRLGKLTKDISAEYLLLIFMALSSYPVAFSQNTKMITGMTFEDPRFQKRWSEAIGTVAALLSEAIE
jgi:hypothetical protein